MSEWRRLGVLHVDDEAGFAEMAADMLEREDDRFAVETATSASEGLGRLEDTDYDCIISDYDMPGQNGIDFLETVREDHPDLPFVLYTGKGSEEIASDAISAGVTEYLQKGSGTGQYAVLANRIENAVGKYRAQAQLAEREKRLDLFVEQSPLGVIEWDEDFDIARVNDAGEDILGYEEHELLGRSWKAIVPGGDRDAVDEVVSALLGDQGGYHSINENVREDGAHIVCEWHNRVVTDEAGDVVAIFSQFQDITDRVVREKRLEAILEHTTAPLFMKNRDGEYLLANKGWRQLFGFEDADVLGRTDADLFSDETDTEARQNDRHVLETGESVTEEERVVVDGVERTFLTSKTPVYDIGTESDPDHPVAVFGVAKDITDRKERERRLERQTERFERLASAVSHDLRTPLETARGQAELAIDTGDIQRVRKALAAIERTDELRASLVEALRTGTVVADTQPVAVGRIARAAWNTVPDTSHASLEILDAFEVEADPDALKRLLENLLSNALKHGDATRTVRIGSTDDGFFVEDDGPGIPEDEREDVFSPGYSTRSGGSGVGLASVRQIAMAHGWDIHIVESAAGGARFEITGAKRQ